MLSVTVKYRIGCCTEVRPSMWTTNTTIQKTTNDMITAFFPIPPACQSSRLIARNLSMTTRATEIVDISQKTYSKNLVPGQIADVSNVGSSYAAVKPFMKRKKAVTKIHKLVCATSHRQGSALILSDRTTITTGNRLMNNVAGKRTTIKMLIKTAWYPSASKKMCSRGIWN